MTFAPVLLFVAESKLGWLEAAFEKLKAILSLGSSADNDRLVSTGEGLVEDETCGCESARVGVLKVKECRGSAVGLHRESERL